MLTVTSWMCLCCGQVINADGDVMDVFVLGQVIAAGGDVIDVFMLWAGDRCQL